MNLLPCKHSIILEMYPEKGHALIKAPVLNAYQENKHCSPTESSSQKSHM